MDVSSLYPNISIEEGIAASISLLEQHLDVVDMVGLSTADF